MYLFIINMHDNVDKQLEKACKIKPEMCWRSGGRITHETLKNKTSRFDNYVGLFVKNNGDTRFISETYKKNILEHYKLKEYQHEIIEFTNQALNLFLIE